MSVPPPPNQLLNNNQSLWHLSPSQRRTSLIPPVSLCVCMSIPLIVARQRLGKHVPEAMNTHNNRRIVGSDIFCAVLVISTKSLWVCLYIPVSLLDKDSVNTFPRQRIFVGGFVFCAVHAVSKENRRLVLSRTCNILSSTHISS
jgi:hypothetical protein